MDTNLPDPTDWLKTTVPSIQALETLLRCQVCKEYFTAPMVTSCGHTFCSLCIRKCLSSNQKCPTCMSTDEESRLRKNTAVQEIMVTFKDLRDQLLEKLTVVEEDNSLIAAAGSEATDGKRVEKRGSYEIDEIENDGVSERRRGKRRRQEDSPRFSDSNEERPRRSTRSSSQRTTSKMSTQVPIVIDDSGGDDDFDPSIEDSDIEPDTPKSKRKQSSRGFDGPSDTRPQCPICGRRKDDKSIEAHVNRCIDGNRSPSPELNGQASSPLKKPSIPFQTSKAQPASHRDPYTDAEKQNLRIAKHNFSLIKEVDIRRKLTGYGLKAETNAKGKESKAILWQRLVEWTNLWNANLDSDSPKTKQALIRELEFNERSQQNQKPSVVQGKEFEREAWGNSHKSNFDDLIADARKRNAKKKEEKENSAAMDDGAPKTTDIEASPKSMVNLTTTEVTGVGSPEMSIEAS